LYGYATGTFSSRRLMARCETDVAFRVIVGEDIPDFRTISDFRKRHLAALEGLFVEVLKLCAKAGLVKVGRIALDGSKVKANASRHKAMSYDYMLKEEQRLKQEIQALLAEADQADQAEDKTYGRDRRGDERPGPQRPSGNGRGSRPRVRTPSERSRSPRPSTTSPTPSRRS
jgi:hypothetical protein